jgi:hypothetical protein
MPFTTTEIMGGLGNQLFQIFNLVAYSLRHRTPFYFSTEPIQHGKRKQTYWHTPLLQTLKPFVKQNTENQQRIMTVYEQGFHYQPLPLPDDYHYKMKFFGYFQSYKYFVDQQANIYKLLKLPETQKRIKEQTQDRYSYDKNLLAIHFRVGDYVQLPNHHPLMTLEYYTQALRQFIRDQATQDQATQDQATQDQATQDQATQDQATQDQATQDQATMEARPWPILYFCEENDQPYVESQFIEPLQAHPELKNKFTFQCIDHSLPDWTQLIVMSLCRHHIIANSTFSWWGAYLGGIPPHPPIGEWTHPFSKTPPTSEWISPSHISAPNEGSSFTPNGGLGDHPHVYYPSIWFGPAMGYKNMTDLFLPHWKLI